MSSRITNTLPMTVWAMFELIKDPSLFRKVRDEVLNVLNEDPGQV